MTVSDAAWERIRANPAAPRASFLSMLDWKEQWIDGDRSSRSRRRSPTCTASRRPATSCSRSGSRRRSRSTTRAAAACRAGVRAMGLELWPRSDEIAAACVTAIAVPDGLDRRRRCARTAASATA